MTKYRIRLANGRVIGPFEKQQLFELKSKGHIKGEEEAQVFPTGSWHSIKQAEFYSEMMDDDRTSLQKPSTSTKEETFVIDLTKLRNQKKEKEIEELDAETNLSVEELTETIRITREEKNTLSQLDNFTPEPLLTIETAITLSQDLDLPAGYEENTDLDKTAINPVAQQEKDRIRRFQAAEEAKKVLEQEAKRKAVEDSQKIANVLARDNAALTSDASTQMFKLDRALLLETASEEEINLEIESNELKKQKAKEENNALKEEMENEAVIEDQKKFKKKKIIIFAAIMAIAYVVLFPEEKPKKKPFKHLEPRIEFPIPYDLSDEKKSKVEYNRGLELFNKGNYPSIIKAGLNFKASYENNLENVAALNLMVRSYAEQLVHSSAKLADAHTLFNIIQSKRPFLLQDPNGVIGISLFYTAINKNDAAIDVVSKYLKLNPKNITQDLFAIYLNSLMKQGKLDLAQQFYKALFKAPDKNRYGYAALIEYHILNQETDKALGYVNDALKKNQSQVMFYLKKAEILLKQSRYKEVIPFLKKAEALNFEYNNLNRSKFLELKGLIYAYEGKSKEATSFLTKSLKLNDTDDLRIKLAELSTAETSSSETDKLINESKAVKNLLLAKDFYEKKNYELALSYAARASDAFSGHIASELFLAKVQLRLGLAKESIKTLEELIKIYPNDKSINIALAETYIDTYKFNNAKNRIQIISASEYKDTWEYASLNAKLNLKMNDSLQSMSWLQNSIKMNPLNDSDIYYLSEILLKRGNADATRILLNKCIELDPANPDYRLAYARMIYESQDDQAAIGYLLSLQEDFGENPKILSEIAIFYYRAGKVKDYQDVRAKLEKLYSTDKSLYEFLIKAALLDERNSEIPVLVEKLLTIEPGDLNAMMTAGQVLFESGKLVEAAKWFKRVQDKLPSYPKVLYYIAKIDFLSNDLDGAMIKIKENIKENGENDADLVFMAQIHSQKNEFVEAENLYKRAQKLNPRSYEAIIGLADISTKRNNHDLALDLYKRAMKLKEDEPIVHKKIGDVYRQLGQGALAIEAYKLYLEMDPESPHKKNLEAYINLMK